MSGICGADQGVFDAQVTVGVDRCGDRGMAQQFLDTLHPGPSTQQPGRVGVPEPMRGEVDPGREPPVLRKVERVRTGPTPQVERPPRLERVRPFDQGDELRR